MGILVIFLINPTNNNLTLLVLFASFHTFMSIIFFSINDSVYKRFLSRQLSQISGLFSSHPWLSNIVVIFLLFFIGLPLTIKFYIEILLMSKFYFYNKIIFFLFIFFIQYVTVVIIYKNVICILFGVPNYYNKVDLTKFEFISYTGLLVILLIISLI